MPSTKIYTLQNTGIPILYTFYYMQRNQTRKNRSTLDMTAMCFPCGSGDSTNIP